MSAKERSFERTAEDVKGLMGFFSAVVRQGDLIYYHLSPCSKGASAFSVVLHILRVFPAPTLSLGKLLLLAQLLS